MRINIIICQNDILLDLAVDGVLPGGVLASDSVAKVDTTQGSSPGLMD